MLYEWHKRQKLKSLFWLRAEAILNLEDLRNVFDSLNVLCVKSLAPPFYISMCSIALCRSGTSSRDSEDDLWMAQTQTQTLSVSVRFRRLKWRDLLFSRHYKVFMAFEWYGRAKYSRLFTPTVYCISVCTCDIQSTIVLIFHYPDWRCMLISDATDTSWAGRRPADMSRICREFAVWIQSSTGEACSSFLRKNIVRYPHHLLNNINVPL